MPCLFKRSNGYYYLVVSQRDRYVWRSTRTKDREEANAVIQRDFLDLIRASRGITLSQFFDDFSRYASVNLAFSTLELYEHAIDFFINVVGTRLLTTYTIKDVEEFKIVRSGQVSATSVNIEFRTLKVAFEMAVRWGYLKTNPFKGVRQLRVSRDRPSFLSRADLERLLAVIRKKWFADLIRFGVCTMMRRGEITNLTWNCVDLERRLILVESQPEDRIKTPHPHSVPMNPWVFEFLSTIENRQAFLFCQMNGRPYNKKEISKMFRRYAGKAGLDKSLHFHSLRHTGASWLVQSGVSIYEVQKLLGHTTITTTQVYAHLAPNQLHEAVNRIAIS